MEFAEKNKELLKDSKVINTAGSVSEDVLKERLDKQEQLHKQMTEQEKQTNASKTAAAIKNEQVSAEKNTMADPLLKQKVAKEEGFEEKANPLLNMTPLEKILDDADNFAPTIKWSNSYALKLVKRQLLEVKQLSRNKDKEGGKMELRRSLMRLKSTCETYKRIKFRKGTEPKNDRHRRVQAILESAEEELKKNSRITTEDVNYQFEESRRKLDDLQAGKLTRIKDDVSSINEMLNKNISANKEKLLLDLYRLKEVYYAPLVKEMQQYLDKHISWSTENEQRYLAIHDMIDQFKIEMSYMEKINDVLAEQMIERGAVTYKDLLCKDFTAVKVIKKEEKKDNIAASVLTGACDFSSYKKIEKNGDDHTFDETDLKSMEDIVTRAKKEKLAINYSEEALMQLREAQIVDMILGIKDRSESSIRYKVRKTVFQGTKTLMIDSARMMDNTGAFSETELPKEITIPEHNFKMYKYAYGASEKKFKKLSDGLDKKIDGIDPAVIEKALEDSGMKLSDKSRELFEKRLSAVKKALKEPKTGDPKYVNYEYVIDSKQSYKKEELLERELQGKTATKSAETLPASKKKLLDAKHKIAEDIKIFCNDKNSFRIKKKDGDGHETDKISELRDYILTYASLDATAEKKEALKYVGREKRKMYNEVRDMYSGAADLFDGYKEEEKEDTDEDYVDSVTGYENVRNEKKYMKEILKRIDEYKAEIKANLAKTDEELLADESYVFSKSVKTENGYKTEEVKETMTAKKIRNRWLTEEKRLSSIEGLFNFRNGTLITHATDTVIKGSDVILYRRKKASETGVKDANGDEQPFVESKLYDMSSEPVFVHEPCIEDVLQGGLGDCYLIGTLASIVEKNPDFIKDMMKEQSDGTVNVRLYDAKGNRVIVNIDKKVPSEYSRGALWVKLVEKAYAVSGLVAEYEEFEKRRAEAQNTLKDPDAFASNKRDAEKIRDYFKVKEMTRNKEDGQPDTRTGRLYESIESGTIDRAFRIITGSKSGESMNVIDTYMGVDSIKNMLKVSKNEVMSTYGEFIDKTIETIEQKQKDTKSKFIFVAGSYPYLYVTGENKDSEANAIRGGVAGPHLYSLLGIENKGGKKMVRLRNPWGHGKVHYMVQESTGKKIPVLGDDTDAGTFLMHVEDFASCFRDVSMLDLNTQVK